MIRNTVVNTVSFLYPLGTTPAVCLTQDLPPESSADILLLGCGDLRNILFTCFIDSGRKLDITCCDIEADILARNVILLTLLIEDSDDAKFDLIWNIYFHWKLDSKSIRLLERQADKLLSFSESNERWQESPIGGVVHFCDTGTMTKLRKCWQGYSSTGLSENEALMKEIRLHEAMDKAKAFREKLVGPYSATFSSFRSCAPAGVAGVEDYSEIWHTWWAEGCVPSTTFSASNANRINPTFFSLTKSNLLLHYGTEPLTGLPLAAAYIPLAREEDLFIALKSNNSQERLVSCAKKLFRSWAKSFRLALTQGLVLRFSVADALSFALTLHTAGSKFPERRLSASIFRDSWNMDSLILTTEHYGEQGTAPLLFDIIDTSNLIDHIGPLNLIPVSATLLKTKISSAIYTESLVQHDINPMERLSSLFGTDPRSFALLLGISPVEMWTDATNKAEDEILLVLAGQKMTDGRGTEKTVQVRSSLRWKRAYGLDGCGPSTAIHVESCQAAKFFVKIYEHMFRHRDPALLLAKSNARESDKTANPYYNSASFSLLLKIMQRTMITDWSACITTMMQQLLNKSSTLCRSESTQELYLYLHMTGILTTKLPHIDSARLMNNEMASHFGRWLDTPQQVCLTIQIPRRVLKAFTNKPLHSVGSPTFQCTIVRGTSSVSRWSSEFSAIQVAFGQVEYIDKLSKAELHLSADDSHWWGSSDLIMSFFVPTWLVLLSERGGAVTIKCGLLPTCAAAAVFYNDFGLPLHFFETRLTNKDVFITRNMPDMSGLPYQGAQETAATTESHDTTIAQMLSGRGISTLTKRLNNIRPQLVTLAKRAYGIGIQFSSLLSADITVTGTTRPSISFPAPIDPDRLKATAAEDFSDIEFKCPLWNPTAESCPHYISLLFMSKDKETCSTYPVSWTCNRVNIDKSPEINLEKRGENAWLRAHVITTYSAMERCFREGQVAGTPRLGKSFPPRIDLKDTLFSLLMGYSGLQEKKTSIFGLEKGGETHVLLLASCLRLDLINHTVVLDAAAIPLADYIASDPKTRKFFNEIVEGARTLCFRVTHEGLECWKAMLPALAERCRTWSHTERCEYVVTGRIPLEEGFKNGRSPLCACGVGKFPAKYLQGLKVSGLDYMLKHYATRVAISPIFPVPYVEDFFLEDVFKELKEAREESKCCQSCQNGGTRRPLESLRRID